MKELLLKEESTTDGANYQGLGEVIPTGKSKDELDAALGTGCAVYNESDGLYYIYYTGHTTREVVMRATSPDFKTWTKDREWMLRGSDNGYSDVDFRDPQVFQDDNGLWHMIIASNLKFAEYTSENLRDWKYDGQTSIGCRIRGIKDGKEQTYYVYNNCSHEAAYKETGSFDHRQIIISVTATDHLFSGQSDTR